MTKRTGQCLCGAVKVSGDISKPEIQACHCVQCQRWTGGGPYLAIELHNLEIEGGNNIHAYHASAWGERGNCATCGTPIYWRMQGKTPRTIALGLLDDQSGMTLSQEIFTDHRPDWLPEAQGASQSTKAQEQAKLATYLKANPS